MVYIILVSGELTINPHHMRPVLEVHRPLLVRLYPLFLLRRFEIHPAVQLHPVHVLAKCKTNPVHLLLDLARPVHFSLVSKQRRVYCLLAVAEPEANRRKVAIVLSDLDLSQKAPLKGLVGRLFEEFERHHCHEVSLFHARYSDLGGGHRLELVCPFETGDSLFLWFWVLELDLLWLRFGLFRFGQWVRKWLVC